MISWPELTQCSMLPFSWIPGDARRLFRSADEAQRPPQEELHPVARPVSSPAAARPATGCRSRTERSLHRNVACVLRSLSSLRIARFTLRTARNLKYHNEDCIKRLTNRIDAIPENHSDHAATCVRTTCSALRCLRCRSCVVRNLLVLMKL